MTHDYTVREWGHDFGIDTVAQGGEILKVHGWGKSIAAGHYLILPNGARTTRYEVEEITYFRDPSDMWKATLRFAPRDA